MFGAYTPTPAGGTLVKSVRQTEKLLGRRLDIVHTFRRWDRYDNGYTQAADDAFSQLVDGGRNILLTWEPFGTNLADIAAGLHDHFITGWVRGLRELHDDVYLRFAHEFNGDWYPWGQQDPAVFRKAWWRIRNIRDRHGARNIKMVWSPNRSDQPAGNKGGHYLESYWPGREGVDVIGLSAYNKYSGWRSPYELIAPIFVRIVGGLDDAGDLPFWLCETGTPEDSEDPSRKGAWLSRLFQVATEMFGIDAVVYQHATGGHDWRLDTSPASLNAAREVFAT